MCEWVSEWNRYMSCNREICFDFGHWLYIRPVRVVLVLVAQTMRWVLRADIFTIPHRVANSKLSTWYTTQSHTYTLHPHTRDSLIGSVDDDCKMLSKYTFLKLYSQDPVRAGGSVWQILAPWARCFFFGLARRDY